MSILVVCSSQFLLLEESRSLTATTLESSLFGKFSTHYGSNPLNHVLEFYYMYRVLFISLSELCSLNLVTGIVPIIWCLISWLFRNQIAEQMFCVNLAVIVRLLHGKICVNCSLHLFLQFRMETDLPLIFAFEQ